MNELNKDLLDKVINKDCIQGMRDLPSECVDLIIADPPYNLNKDFGEWKELEKRYHMVTGEIYQQRKEGVVISETPTELKQLAESLVAVICDWIEFNSGQIIQGKLKA